MKPAGAPHASLLHALRSRRRLPLLVLLVLVFQALAPLTISGSARAGELTTVLCTADGARHVVVVDEGVPSQASSPHAHCPFCGAQWQPLLPTASDPLWIALPATTDGLPATAALPAEPRRLIAAHRTRAPPGTR